MPKVSVIVPIYNREQYLKQCVDSIVNQTLTDIEILLIDDGSTDNSGAICDAYAAQDGRVCVLHVQNGGVSRARNLGIDMATGEWVYFVDSDDWIDLRTLELAMGYVEGTDLDMLVWNVNVCREKSKVIKLPPITECVMSYNDKKEYELYLFCRVKITRYFGMRGPSNRIFKLSIIRNSKLSFNEMLQAAEDIVFNLHYISYANTIKFVNEYWYNVNESIDSLSRGYHSDWPKRLTNTISAFRSYVTLYHNDDIDYENMLNKRIVLLIMNMLKSEFFNKDNEKKFANKCAELKKTLAKEPFKSGVQKVDLKGFDLPYTLFTFFLKKNILPMALLIFYIKILLHRVLKQ